ncbi:MAG: universal stress protein [Thermoplasmatota archaeon]
MEQYKRILIPTDGSESNEKVVDKGLSLARLLGAKVKLLFVVDTSTFADVPPDELITTLKGYMEAEGNNVLDRIEDKAEDMGIEIEKSIMDGHPAKVIIKESEKQDIIVMGSHGRSGITKLLMGSTAEKVIHQGKCPVMVVRIEEE